MTGTQNLAILRSGDWKTSPQRNQDLGIPEKEMYKENKATILVDIRNS